MLERWNLLQGLEHATEPDVNFWPFSDVYLTAVLCGAENPRVAFEEVWVLLGNSVVVERAKVDKRRGNEHEQSAFSRYLAGMISMSAQLRYTFALRPWTFISSGRTPSSSESDSVSDMTTFSFSYSSCFLSSLTFSRGLMSSSGTGERTWGVWRSMVGIDTFCSSLSRPGCRLWNLWRGEDEKVSEAEIHWKFSLELSRDECYCSDVGREFICADYTFIVNHFKAGQFSLKSMLWDQTIQLLQLAS